MWYRVNTPGQTSNPIMYRRPQALKSHPISNMVSHLWSIVRIPARVVTKFSGQVIADEISQVDTAIQVKHLCVRYHRKTVGRLVTDWGGISRSFRPTCLRTADMALLNSPLLQPT